MVSSNKVESVAVPVSGVDGKFLCLTICGYKKTGMDDEAYRHHMTQVSAPMTKDLMVKYGIVRWTQIHNQPATRAMMSQLYDSQMARLADFDCFSQVVFKRLEDYKLFKGDPEYKRQLTGDHEKFADTKKSMMTIGWIEQFIDSGIVVEGLEDPAKSQAALQTTALVTGSFLSGAMMALSSVAVPVFLDTTKTAAQMYTQWARMYHYGHLVMPALSIVTCVMYIHVAAERHYAGKRWGSWLLAGVVTVLMVPFTLIIMAPTNDALFRLEAETRAGVLKSTLNEAGELVTRWGVLHFVRALFPLLGALVGALGMLQKLFF